MILDSSRCAALIFDMDGVITDSVPAHRRAWKRTFDAFLAGRRTAEGEPQQPFNDIEDYLAYVDGKPRYDGVRSFLRSRGITLPEGSPNDPTDMATVCGLGNQKNETFLRGLAAGGVTAYRSTLDLIAGLHSHDIAVALITSSRNADAVLASAGVDEAIFDALVDGREAARLGLPGKPDPAVFIEAASRIGAAVDECVVVEDAVSGVTAGVAGGFAGVLGIDRGSNRSALEAAGAHVVVEDLEGVTIR